VTRFTADFFCLSASHSKPLGKQSRQTSLRDFLLRGGEIVFYSQQFDEVVLDVVNTISGAPVSVTGLTHAAGVDEIFFAWLNTNVLGGLTPTPSSRTNTIGTCVWPKKQTSSADT
jgi:hypothetical protein